MATITSVVFDIGNVIVRWDPILILERTFGSDFATPQNVRAIFGHPLWYQLNRGEISEDAAKQAYGEALGFSPDILDKLFFHIKDSQALKVDTVDLMDRLHAAGHRLFALSDNVHEIVAHLKQTFDFWAYLEGAVISAEVGHTKPSAEIFQHLLSTYNLRAEDTVFFDDVERNVTGARTHGIQAFHFTHAGTAEAQLQDFGIRF